MLFLIKYADESGICVTQSSYGCVIMNCYIKSGGDALGIYTAIIKKLFNEVGMVYWI